MYLICKLTKSFHCYNYFPTKYYNVRKIKTDKENDDSTESFMEMVKKISDNISTDKFSDQTENEEEIIEQDEDNLSQEARKNLREEIENLKEEVKKIKMQLSGGSFESITENEKNVNVM